MVDVFARAPAIDEAAAADDEEIADVITEVGRGPAEVMM